MISKLSKNIMIACLTLSVSGMLTCCSDDNVILDSANGKSQYAEGTTIGFDVALDANMGKPTRSDMPSMEVGDDAEIDNYVDIAKKYHDFRVVFFDENDNFLFEATQYDIKQVNDDSYVDGSYIRPTSRWRVEMPVAALEKAGVMDKITSNSFKIAVLANWPKNHALTFSENDKIYKISQYWPDNIYAENEVSYNHLPKVEDGVSLMGAYRDWVDNEYSSQVIATEKVRENSSGTPYKIERKKDGGLQETTHVYKHIWRLWNFGLTDSITGNTDFWSKQLDEEKLGKIATDGLTNYGSFYEKEGENDGLSFVSGSDNQRTEQTIKMRPALSVSNHNAGVNLTQNYFSFNAYATGTLRVWVKSGSTDGSYLGIQRGNDENQRVDFIQSMRNKINVDDDKDPAKLSSDELVLREFDISVTGTNNDHVPGDPVNVKIYSVGGTTHIYQIEYIEDKYLYETDRQGKLPTKDYAIPMYGVQTFDPVKEEYLKMGQTYNLSSLNILNSGERDDYNHKKVYLLRSLAKVELLLPLGAEPEHVYFRFMNRTNRCEPVDVYTPTNEIWDYVDNEITLLTTKGRFFDKSIVKEYDTYRNALAWFYGAWTEWKGDAAWNWNDAATYEANPAEPAPRVFNTRINRSNYAHFIKDEVVTVPGFGQKQRYILYVPEKNVADPNVRGDMSNTPKVAHIELRYAQHNDDNLDDNGCFRIYFADKQPPQHSSENRYDYTEEDYIENFLPIVRNHIYRFIVPSIPSSAKSRNGGAGSVEDCTMTVLDF